MVHMVAPCVPKQSKVHESTENINAVRLDVIAYRTAVATANSPDGSNVLRAKSFYLIPESKSPKPIDEKPARPRLRIVLAPTANGNLNVCAGLRFCGVRQSCSWRKRGRVLQTIQNFSGYPTSIASSYIRTSMMYVSSQNSTLRIAQEGWPYLS